MKGAVVDIDNEEPGTGQAALERLRGELDEVKDQLSATSDVLTAIGRSASDVDAVLGAVVDSTRQLCHADVAQIHLVEGEVLKLARSSGLSEAGVDYMARNPVGPDRRSLLGRVRLYGQIQQITDVLSDPDYTRFDLQRLAGLRTVLGVPMQLDDELVGVLVVWRIEVKPFGDRETAVLTTFAAQAAIAIRQANLLRDLENRQQELHQTVEQLEALGEIGQAVSSSLDLDEVLTASSPTRCCCPAPTAGPCSSSWTTDFRCARPTAPSPDCWNASARRGSKWTARWSAESAIGDVRCRCRTCGKCRPTRICRLLREAGWRSMLAVPMLREGPDRRRPRGAPQTPGGFSEETSTCCRPSPASRPWRSLNARLFRRAGAQLGRAGGGQPAQVGVPGQHVARTAHTAQRGDRLLRGPAGADVRRPQRTPGGVPARHPGIRVGTCWNCSTTSWTCRRSRRAGCSSNGRPSRFRGARVRPVAAPCAAASGRASSALEVDGDVGSINCDELRFKQVLLNLSPTR